MKRWNLCLLALAVSLTAAAGPGGRDSSIDRTRGGNTDQPQAFTERSAGTIDVEAELLARQDQHQALVAEMPAGALDRPIIVAVSAKEQSLVDEPLAQPAPVRVGLVKSVARVISLADLDTPLSDGSLARPHGAVRIDRDGFTYTLAIVAPGATALRLHFTDFWLADGIEVYLLTLDGEVFGPYSGSGPLTAGEFWSHSLVGERILVQVRGRVPLAAALAADANLFTIADVGYILGAPVMRQPAAAAEKAFCTFNAPCIQNEECGTAPAVNDAKYAVAHMEWISGPYIYMCTGGLLADTVTTSAIPYFLTANHCISLAKDATALENFFQFTRSCGTTSCPTISQIRSGHPPSLRTLGATIRKTSSTSDYTLLELNQPAPAGSAYLGWTSTAVATANGTPLYRISHPGGAPQAYSEQKVNTSRGTCSSWPRGAWIYSEDTFGGTEGGSSGSPVVNGSGQVVGQLSGGCGTNVGDPCDAVHNSTVDGAFANYFIAVKPFLDPTTCVPSTENCSNGIDDDCDGLVDCADPNCLGSSSCGCRVAGSSCTVNSECCSNRCRSKRCR